jgi:uncharacterized membrane protein YdjX (TVP38/TMEM64 family)
VALLLVFSPTFTDVVKRTTGWVEGIMKARPVTGAVVFVLFSALSAMLAFTSSVALVPPASLVWGKLVTFLLLWCGWIAGAIAAFAIGRLAHPLLVRMGYEDTLEKYEKFVSKRMKFWAVLLFCIAVPSEVPGYLFGGAHYPFLKFLVAIAIAEAMYAVLVVVVGESLAVAKPVPLLAAAGVLVVIGAAAGLALRAARKRRA